MNDEEVIDAFVAHLRSHGHPGLHVERRPDKENRDSSDIDAIAGTFAIEHTSIDTLPNQRRDADWFMRAAGEIEGELDGVLPFRLNITLDYGAIGMGQNWSAVRGALKHWIVNEASRLEDGPSKLDNLPDIPFTLHVIKSSDRPPGLFFARFEPDDDTLSSRIKLIFDRKVEKLAKYQTPGVTTVLLIESNDIALMNDWKLFEAIRTAFPGGLPPGVDQVWYADTSIPKALQFREFTPQLRASADPEH